MYPTVPNIVSAPDSGCGNNRMWFGFIGSLREQNFHAAVIPLILFAIGAVRSVGSGSRVQGNLILKPLPQGVGHLRQRELLICKPCVASHGRHYQAIQAGAYGWVLFEAPVCMPIFGEYRGLLVGAARQGNHWVFLLMGTK